MVRAAGEESRGDGRAPLRTVRSLAPALLLALASILPGCEPAGREVGPGEPVRETLANGVTLVRYGSLPEPTAEPLVPDLVLGTGTEDPDYLFGDVRGIDADHEGTIYVLDYQISEVRAYDRDGRFVRTVAGRGEGPGEISEANGMILVGDSILWIQDHSKWTMIGVSLDGTELARVPMHVRSYGYAWNGAVDNAGLFGSRRPTPTPSAPTRPKPASRSRRFGRT